MALEYLFDWPDTGPAGRSGPGMRDDMYKRIPESLGHRAWAPEWAVPTWARSVGRARASRIKSLRGAAGAGGRTVHLPDVRDIQVCTVNNLPSSRR
ncbi:hypothetical protein GCM10011579_093150 [Streptomyces albiflavescens]|uniref:Uncharacterized protein n=1 Tax=Streptomyces albiflavescens TaxID=1623582 RepID=A0A918DAY8_9ACTN|nr:hypothetical protein GCM10011579_093150 [Streptomyces albiflavescens]